MQEIIVDIQDGTGILKLNRPDKLNCLNSTLISQLKHILEEWRDDKRVERVVLMGKGRSFCAGGDVVALVEAWNQGDHNAASFFEKEYEVDHLIATFPKAIFCLAHGAVMGGGIGLFQGARHRYLDPEARLAMPEITIGLFPDVGASYFLNRLPHCWGMLLGLTGMRLPAGVAVELGLADGLIQRDFWGQFIDQLALMNGHDEHLIGPSSEDRAFVKKIEQECHHLFPWPGLQAFDSWARHYSGMKELEMALAQYLSGSPTSAAVIERQLLRGQELTLEEAYQREALMAQAFMKEHDFREGVRALLIDKDKKPRWKPSSLTEVSNEIIQRHFQ